jgi:hypothetical protein
LLVRTYRSRCCPTPVSTEEVRTFPWDSSGFAFQWRQAMSQPRDVQGNASTRTRLPVATGWHFHWRIHGTTWPCGQVQWPAVSTPFLRIGHALLVAPWWGDATRTRRHHAQ